jgi:hypothetical protein
MDDSQKIIKPRPVKRMSNILGVKIITEFEKIIPGITHKTLTPCSKLKSNCSLKKSVSEILTYEVFQKDIRDSSSTSELLSILNNESTGIDSLLYNSEIADLNEEFFILNDDLRISMPPIRCKNPFFKNFNTDKELNYDDNNYYDNIDYFDVDVNDPK